MILFSQYYHKIIEIKERPLKNLLILTSILWKWIKKQSYVISELAAWLQKRENFDDTNTDVKDLTLASLKFKSENTVKSTKSNLKEEELEAVVRICSLK